MASKKARSYGGGRARRADAAECRWGTPVIHETARLCKSVIGCQGDVGPIRRDERGMAW
jgi:hypothetical protein